MNSLVTAFQSLIPNSFILKKNGGYWAIEEPGAGHSLFEISSGLSQAFTLDKDGINVFPFFTNNLVGVNSVNDAIIVTVVNGEPYVVAVEMKTSKTKVSDALMQIESGRQFVLWARSLLSIHGHWKGGACKFFGIVSLKPRRQLRKGMTSRSAEIPAPELHAKGDYPYFVLENHHRVSTADLVKKIIDRYGQCKVAA